MSATLPKGILYLTVGADCQADRLIYLVVGWGKGRECWLIETGAIHGEPREAKVWEELAQATIEASWSFAGGGVIRIGRMFVDTGFHWEETLSKVTRSNGAKPLPVKSSASEPAKTPARGRSAKAHGAGVHSLKPVRSIAGLTLADFLYDRQLLPIALQAG
jgi:phage terminase large subunit GpA-like protein